MQRLSAGATSPVGLSDSRSGKRSCERRPELSHPAADRARAFDVSMSMTEPGPKLPFSKRANLPLA